MHFELVGEITEVETIASARGTRDLARLRRRYGASRWCKLKSLARMPIAGARIQQAEVHWYEAHSLGRVRMNIKRFVD